MLIIWENDLFGYDYLLEVAREARLYNPDLIREAMRQLAEADPVMAEIIRQKGLFQMASLPPTFETLARSITFQQLNGKAAKVIFDRLKKATGRRFTAAALSPTRNNFALADCHARRWRR